MEKTQSCITYMTSPVAWMVKTVSNAEDLVSIPGLGRYFGEGNGCPLQYSCLEYSMDRGAWGLFSPWASKSQM